MAERFGSDLWLYGGVRREGEESGEGKRGGGADGRGEYGGGVEEGMRHLV